MRKKLILGLFLLYIGFVAVYLKTQNRNSAIAQPHTEKSQSQWWSHREIFSSEKELLAEIDSFKGFPVGRYRYYYPEGQLASKGYFFFGWPIPQQSYYRDGQLKSPEVDRLEGRFRGAPVRSNVAMHDHADLYFDLGKGYLKQGRKFEARQVLEEGIRVAPFHCQGQMMLAKMEVEEEKIPDAVSRLKFIEKTCRDEKLLENTRELLAQYPNVTFDQPIVNLPQIDRDLYLVFEPNVPGYLRDYLTEQIEKVFSLNIQVIDEPYVLPDELLAKSQKQLDADRVLNLALPVYSHVLKAPKSLGLMIVMEHDLRVDNLNFIFGTADIPSKIGVMSIARFSTPAKEVLKSRVVKQAFSTVGFILGLGRCTMPECARAYPHSVREHDQKSEQICLTCLKRLYEIYQR